MKFIILAEVKLENGNSVWVGHLNEYPLATKDISKLKIFLRSKGIELQMSGFETFSVSQFLKFAMKHPILKTVPDWNKMGISNPKQVI